MYKRQVNNISLERVLSITGTLRNRHVIVVGNYFTKWVETLAIPNQQVTTIAKVLVHKFYYYYYGILELYRLLRRGQRLPLHPQFDGIVESFNRTLEQHLSEVVDENHTDWVQWVYHYLNGL